MAGGRPYISDEAHDSALPVVICPWRRQSCCLSHQLHECIRRVLADADVVVSDASGQRRRHAGGEEQPQESVVFGPLFEAALQHSGRQLTHLGVRMLEACACATPNRRRLLSYSPFRQSDHTHLR